MGGMIAQELAIRHPERVLTLTSIMSNTGAPDVRGPSLRDHRRGAGSRFRPIAHAFIERAVALARTLHGGGFPFEDARVRRSRRALVRSRLRPGGVRRQLSPSGSRAIARRRWQAARPDAGDPRRRRSAGARRRRARDGAGNPGRAPRDDRRHGPRAAAPGPGRASSTPSPRSPADARRDQARRAGADRYPFDYIDKGGLAVTDNARGCSGTPTWELAVRGALDPRTCAPRSPTWPRAIRRCAAARARSTGPTTLTARRFAWTEAPDFTVEGIFRAVDARDPDALAALAHRSRTARSIRSPTSR